jgi:putative endonuclease
MPQTPNIGELGEYLVAEWLQAQSWVILHHRWRCRWGEIDLIAQRYSAQQETLLPRLAFVEVKTRSRGNWDADGLLAITPPKQAKLWRTAELFLAERPDLASLPCRFDVALVRCDRISQHSGHNETNSSPSAAPIDKTIQVPSVQLGQPIVVAGYRFMLQDYIESAFD